MLFLIAYLKRTLRERFALRLSFALEILSTCAMLAVFLLIDRFQSSLLGSERLAEAASQLGTTYFGYVALGLAVSELSQSNLGGILGQFHFEKQSRTLPVLLAAPLSLWRWALVAGAGNLLSALFRAVLIFGLAVGVLRLEVGSFSVPLLCAVLFLAVPALWALAILCLVAALLLRRGDPLGFVLGILFDLCGGVYAPVSVLPGFAQEISRWIPLGPALEATHKVVYAGAGWSEVSPLLVRLVVLGSVYLPIAYLLLQWADKRARKRGFYHLT